MLQFNWFKLAKKGLHSEDIWIEKVRLQEFIENKEEWAILIQGYLHHEFPSVQDIIWVFQGDFGIIHLKGCFKCLESNNDQVKLVEQLVQEMAAKATK